MGLNFYEEACINNMYLKDDKSKRLTLRKIFYFPIWILKKLGLWEMLKAFSLNPKFSKNLEGFEKAFTDAHLWVFFMYGIISHLFIGIGTLLNNSWFSITFLFIFNGLFHLGRLFGYITLVYEKDYAKTFYGQ